MADTRLNLIRTTFSRVFYFVPYYEGVIIIF